MDGDSSGGGTRVERFLRDSEHFLSRRNIDGCRKYALQAQEIDPQNAGAAQLLAVAAVIAASETHINDNQRDWYAIMQLNRYTQDSQLIKSQFKNLILLLNPRKNDFELAKDAFDLVRDAVAVLLNDSKKARFDNELKIFEFQSDFKQRNDEKMEGKCGLDDDDTFWTVCPYCYYVYEFPRVYEDCCLRCQNQSCRRGFHAVMIPSPPPKEAVESGRYRWYGFFPLGFEGGEGKRFPFPSWTPFTPMEVKEKDVPEVSNVCEADDFIEISDNSDGSSNEFERKDRRKSTNGDMNEDRTERAENGDEPEVPNVVKPVAKRRKSVARTTKKLMGKGTRINKQETTVPTESYDGLDFVDGGVEFFEGDDDIFVGLQDGF